MDSVTAGKQRDPTLHRLIIELADDVMRLSDAELIAEARDDGGDPERIAAGVRASIQAAIVSSGKARLLEARAAMDRDKASFTNVHNVVRIADRHALLERIACNDPQLKSRLTMAARNGRGITEEEVESILNDLRELGAIDNEGNIL